MAERLESMPGVNVSWEPNAPDAVVIADDHGRGAVALKPHPNDADRRAVVLRFDRVLYSLLTPPNDEAVNRHPLYKSGLNDLRWLGIVRDSSLVARLRPLWHEAAEHHLQPLHFIAGVCCTDL